MDDEWPSELSITDLPSPTLGLSYISPGARVVSPVTALAHDLEVSCRSHSLTPKRRLSLSSAVGNDSYVDDGFSDTTPGQLPDASKTFEFNKENITNNPIALTDDELIAINSRKSACPNDANGPPKLTDSVIFENNSYDNKQSDKVQFPKPWPPRRKSNKENAAIQSGICRQKSAPPTLSNNRHPSTRESSSSDICNKDIMKIWHGTEQTNAEEDDDDAFFDEFEPQHLPDNGSVINERSSSKMEDLMIKQIILSHSSEAEPGTFSKEMQKMKEKYDSKALSASWNGIKPVIDNFERTKRSEPPRGSSPVAIKRSKSQVMSPCKKTTSRLIPRSISCHTFAEPPVIDYGNLGKISPTRYALPKCMGPKCDLRNISPATLAELIRGGYRTDLDEFIIVDCRYPYEYKGGHIKGAINIHTSDGIETRFLSKTDTYHNKKVAVIFHCEFSSKRGPHLCHYLRKRDRNIHADSYPSLYYPELYLLCGGYTAFFEEFKELCEPQNHVKMCDKNYAEELKHFMRKSKTWSGESSKRRRLYTNFGE
ncbi:uncharacterized protein TRIADDRAFT_58617 [Trichoplax adhaerens]|uniref:M-phase inducer phosphatase n=1 Tax=Trichoplax adhaerens TaxID=10228 RepID=B3S370_TRIAD|nr:hypothetical protein TRIADDRAFT_58617 [Trichoplax adhaerens]EDV22737.1 hypothetical protein TRIADDRAFT_58617 [Trichoplax adhaerens]|eukprot:XP_002114603.1 hypothetical protein TRIADDRAFT_58617 [Trichoplax adhaerens]